MGSIKGFGTGYRGWRHGAAGESVATLWLTAMYLPVIPLRRYRLRNHTDFEAERIRTMSQALGAVAVLGGAGVAWEEDVEILERISLDWPEIAETYARSYLLVPLLCLWPFLLGRLALTWISDRGALPPPALAAAIVLCLANVIVVLLMAVRRMRRGPPRILERGG